MKTPIECKAVLIILVICAYAAGQSTARPPERGEEWLSWSPSQRSTYVGGFISGYFGGFLRACSLADELFETKKSHRLGDGHRPTDMPSGRCLVHRGEFTELRSGKDCQRDPSAYTEVITTFYERHANCRDFPFPFLLEILSHKYRSADDLFELAMKGALRHYPRSIQWCDAASAVPPKS